MAPTTELQGEIWDQELSLQAPLIEWGHMVNQLNQDPWADSIADSGCGTTAMEGSKADAAGDEGWKDKMKGPLPGQHLKQGMPTSLHPFLIFTNENSSTTQIPVAASTLILTPASRRPDFGEPLAEEPQVKSPPADDPKLMSIRELIPDYLDIPLVGLNQLELHQVVPWIHFKAQNMCKPPW